MLPFFAFTNHQDLAILCNDYISGAMFLRLRTHIQGVCLGVLMLWLHLTARISRVFAVSFLVA